MYILEQGLPIEWNIIWIIICLPLLYLSYKDFKNFMKKSENYILITVVSFMFMMFFTIISIEFDNPALSGNGLPALVTGVGPTAIITLFAMIFIKLFTGIGGFLSLGANIVSIGVIGPFIGFKLFNILNDKFSNLVIINIAISVVITELVSLLFSCIQLSIAYHYPSFMQMLISYLNMYLISYLPNIIMLLIIEIAVSLILIKYVPEFKMDLKKK